MKKLILIIGVGVIVAFTIYYTGVYTYFLKKEVSEKLPEMAGAAVKKIAAKPKILKQGEFVNADFFHKGSGKAYILEYPLGKKILRFENFETINGPDLYVYLAKTAAPAKNLDSLGDYLDLGALKGNVGDQNYELPSGVDVLSYNSAVIWCKKFGVLFPYAIFK